MHYSRVYNVFKMDNVVLLQSLSELLACRFDDFMVLTKPPFYYYVIKYCLIGQTINCEST